MSLKPYPEYKESHFPLLGDLPSHWEVARLRSALSIKKEIVGDSWSDHLLLSLTLRGVIPRDMENIVGKLPADFTTYQRVQRGDLIFCLFDVEETPRTVGWVPQDGMLTGAYTAASSSPNFDSNYVAYHYLSYDQRKSLRGYYAGLRNTIRSADFANIPIAFPPLEEQRTIVDYLDRETAEIDAFITEQEELIALLGERRTATVTRAVTKGLDANAQMKNSGIADVGKVPAHWVIGPVKRFFTSLDAIRIPLSSEERSYRQGTFPYYGASGVIDMIDDFLFDEPLVLVSEDGANLKMRSSPIAFVAIGQYWVNNHAHILRPDNEAVRFWAERIEAIDVTPWVTGAAQPKLTAEALMNMPISVPSTVNECLQIQQYIIRETAEIDAAITDAYEAIALSKERRVAVISAAVTGKIDLRCALAPSATNPVEAEFVGVA